jgi:excinuclease UvrABC nuclease subunit
MSSRLVYRDPCDAADRSRWAPWLRELRHQSGCYVIRSKKTREILYVGESHTGQLYDTITRHFQSWIRFGRDEYNRNAVELATRIVPAPSAYAHQVRLIKTLRPKDNVVHADDGKKTNPNDFKD